jgi:hypothetical protein
MPIAWPRRRSYQFEMMIWCAIGPDRKYPSIHTHHAAKYSTLDPPMRANHWNARNVSPVPMTISHRGLQRGTMTGPAHNVSSTATGAPSVINCCDQP